MAVERVHPIRDEDPWQSLHGWQGHAYVRVWRTKTDQMTVVISGPGAEFDLETVSPMLRAEYPDDTVDFFFHRPMDWIDVGTTRS